MRRRTLTRLLYLLCLSPVWLTVLAVLALAAAGANGLRYNSTDSMPHGWYRNVDSGDHARKGDLVIAAPPHTVAFSCAVQRGYFKGSDLLLKHLVAVEGDRLDIDEGGVRVNGVPLPHSRPLERDKVGRPLPQVYLPDYPLQAGEILLMSDSSCPWNFDGRYFGPIPRACIQGVVRPVWTW
jgi:conjugative transfer signal peptidase TraF